MRRIAIIQRFLPPASRGGVGHFTHGLANALVVRGHAVTVFSEDPTPPDARYECAAVPVGASALQRKLAPITFPFRVARQDFSGFDVVHAQGDDQWIPRASAPPIVRTLQGSSLSEAIHNGLRRWSPKRFLLHLYFYAGELVSDLRADAVVAISRDTGRHFFRLDEVVPNAIDLERFVPRGRPKSAHPTILFVGELASRKRGHLLLAVVRQWVRPQVPGVQVWLVSPDRVDEDGVEWFGTVDDERLAELYERAWVMCLPSSYEGFGRPYVEAMAAGTAVVASPNPGALEVLDHGRYGLIVSDHDLGPALCRLLTDHDERQAYARRGRERARAFTWDRVAERYEAIYERVLARRAGRTARNVLYLHTTSEVGGSDVSLLRLVERLDRARFRPIVALPADGPLVGQLEGLGCEVLIVECMRKLTTRRGRRYLAQFLLNYPVALWRLARILSDRRVDLVHTNTIHNLYGIGVAIVTRRPHVWHVREIVWQSGLVRRVERFLARFSDRVIATSDAVGRLFETRAGQLAANVRTIPNGVDIEAFAPGPSDGRVRAALGFPPAALIVGVVCRLDAWKGVDLFLRAVRRGGRPHRRPGSLRASARGARRDVGFDRRVALHGLAVSTGGHARRVPRHESTRVAVSPTGALRARAARSDGHRASGRGDQPRRTARDLCGW